MTMTFRSCPSCRHKLSPMTIECPVCGIPLSRPPLKRPLLFHVSKGTLAKPYPQQGTLAKPYPQQGTLAKPYPQQGAEAQTQKRDNGYDTPKSLSAPAIGRITPIDIGDEPADTDSQAFQTYDDFRSAKGPVVIAAPRQKGARSVFWRLALMEFQEALSLLVLNGLIFSVVCWQLELPPGHIYSSFLPYLIALHLLISWAYLMLPMVMTGSSAAMLRNGFGIADAQPEKRLSFSLFMLLSVIFLPLSFLCMVLTPAHTTLAEILTGQEIRERTPELMRRR